MKKAFSLVELMIVVAVIGILAALVIPKVQDYSKQARDAAAKENLQILRDAIELYATKHNGLPPGYMNNDPILHPVPLGMFARTQLINERYLQAIPKNPFNGKMDLRCIGNDVDFPAATNFYGYIYKPATKTIKLDKTGTDSKGTPYSDY